MIEISAIVLAGGAGLVVGDALLAPGPRTRRDALVENGREAIRIVVGLIPVLLVAGLVEGFISPVTEVPASIKVLTGSVLGIALWTWIALAGRGAIEEPA